MYRRLYYLLPTRSHTLEVVEELEQAGINSSDIHTFADEERAETLPGSMSRRQFGMHTLFEKIFWNTDLAVFLLSLIGLLVALYYRSWGWVIVATMAIAVAYLGGKYFADRVPRAPLEDFAEAVKHHEILLSVDVPENRMKEVDSLLDEHPEAVAGGTSWTFHRFGM